MSNTQIKKEKGNFLPIALMHSFNVFPLIYFGPRSPQMTVLLNIYLGHISSILLVLIPEIITYEN